MTLSLILTIWVAASGLLVLVTFAWAALAGLSVPGRAWPSRGLVVVTAGLALLPGALFRLGIGDYRAWLLAGTTLILAAAAFCLLRLRRSEGLLLPADLALAASVDLWLALAAVLFWPA